MSSPDPLIVDELDRDQIELVLQSFNRSRQALINQQVAFDKANSLLERTLKRLADARGIDIADYAFDLKTARFEPKLKSVG